MHTRRSFLAQAIAGGIASASLYANAVPQADSFLRGSGPRAKSPRIKAAIRRDDTILRLGGLGDCFQMTWAADDRQYTGVNDGAGWFEPSRGSVRLAPGEAPRNLVEEGWRLYNSRLWAILGDPRNATFQDVPAYPDLKWIPNTDSVERYYGLGVLALDGYIYQFLSAPNHPVALPGVHWDGVKLIYSADNGRTWCNHDGSTPVVWESRQEHSRQSIMFFDEPQHTFSLLSVLQMGRNYETNRDGYVYIYAPNGNKDGTMNELVLLRTLKNRILHRNEYEFFVSLKANGEAVWAKDITQRGIVHTFPRGWVYDPSIHVGDVPWGWLPSVAYNAPLGLYMMTNWGTGCGPDGSILSKPSYLGFWSAPNPWGPWTQILEEAAWTPDGEQGARCYMPQISPKWIAEDGKSFWLVWSDLQTLSRDELNRKEQDIRHMSQEQQKRFKTNGSGVLPYYEFNIQRVDLLVG